MDELNAREGLTFIEQQELANLEQANQKLLAQKKILEQMNGITQKAAAEEAAKVLEKKSFDGEAIYSQGVYGEQWMGYEQIDILDKWTYTNNKISEQQKEQISVGEKLAQNKQDQIDLQKKLDSYAEEDKTGHGFGWMFGTDEYEADKKALKELQSEEERLTTQNENLGKSISNMQKELPDLSADIELYASSLYDENGQVIEGFEDLASRYETEYLGISYSAEQTAKKTQQAYDDIVNSRKDFQEQYQSLIEKAKEKSEEGGLTAEDLVGFDDLVNEMSANGFSIDDIVMNVNAEAEIINKDELKTQVQESIDEQIEEVEQENKEAKVSTEIEYDAEKAKQNSEEIMKMYEGMTADSQQKVQEFINSSKEWMNWDIGDIESNLNAILNGADETSASVADLTGTIQDLGLVFNDSSDTGLTKAISSYKEQMNSLVSAREKWNKGELSVEDMIGLQQSFAELNEFDMSNFGSGIDAVIDRITGKLGEADTTFKDFKENIIDKDEGLKDALADISSITKQGFKDAESGVTEVYGESVNMIMDAAEKAGLVNRQNTESVNGFIDALFESGIIQGKTGEITKKTTGIMADFEKAIKAVGGEETIAGRALITMRDNLLGIYDQTDEVKSAYATLKDTLGTFSQYQTDVASALKASKSATGLTAEQVQTLTTAYEKLDSFQPDKLFEKTANGIHLNEEEFKRLNKEVQNNTLAQMYSDLAYKFDELNDAKAAGQDTSGLEKDIADAQMLIAQYEGLTSALNAWQQAQSNGNERDSFESVAKGYEGMEKILNQGWYGDESLNAYLDLMLSASERTGDAVADFEKLGQTIEGTGHSLKDYFTFEDGNLVSDGLFNFLDDVNAKMGDSFASIDENGNYMFDFTGEKLQQVADEFGTTTEFIQLMERAMIDAGMAVEMSSSSFETMKETLDGLQSEGKISPDIDLDIDTATASIEDIEGLIQSLESEKARIEVEADGTEETQQTLDTLDRTINTLNGQKITKSIQLAIENGNAVDDLLAMDDTTLAATLNVDASEVDTARQQLEALNGATESTTVTVKLDSSQFDALTDTSKTVTVTYSVDAPEAPTYEDQNPSVTYGITAPTAPTYPNQNPSVTYHISAPSAPYYPNMDRYITYHISTVGSAPSGGGGVDGTAHARGTAFANGNTSGDWGTKSSGVALGGELGEELLVRDGHFYTIGADSAEFFRYKKGDIIFNAEQTKEIFEKGKITHGSGRGEALVSGTAFDSGSGGRRRTSTASGGGSSGGGGRSSGGGGGGSSVSGGSSGGGGSSSSSSSNPDWLDWIEIKIDRVERKISELKRNADNTYKLWESRNKSLSDEIGKVTEEISIQEQAYFRYMHQANSVGLDAGLAQKVREGAIDISQYSSDSDIRKKIDLYKQWYDAAINCKESIDDLNISLSELYEQQFDNIITKWDNALQEFQHSAERAENIIDRRISFASEYVDSNLSYDSSTQNIKDYRSLIDNAIEQRTQRNKELTELANKLQSGINNGTVEKGSESYYNFLGQIQDIENVIDGLNADIINYSNSISAEYENMFEVLSTDYENKIELAEHLSNEYNNFLELAQIKGYKTSEKYYQKLMDIELDNIKQASQSAKDLQSELVNAIGSGEIKLGSQAWYDMTARINETIEAEQKATIAVQEYANKIREIEWGKFDYLQEKIENIREESDFLIDLMSSSDLFDETGAFTDEGIATAGLHAMNYNIAMNQADRYAKEIIAINKEIANDPSNTDLIKRKEDLIKAQKDSIDASEKEKQAIKSLVSDGIKQEMSHIDDLIDRYNNAIQSQKDIYDYQKRIKNHTSEISSLQKQLSAYSNDISEEARAKLQKIRIELDEKKEELEETEYERMVSDTKKMLDSFSDEYEKALNERLDNIDVLIQSVIDASNNGSSEIADIITRKADSVGLTLSDEIKTVWNSNETILTTYGDKYLSKLTSINQVISTVRDAVVSLYGGADTQAEADIQSINAESIAKETSESASSANAESNKLGTKGQASDASTYSTAKLNFADKKNVQATETIESKYQAQLAKSNSQAQFTKYGDWAYVYDYNYYKSHYADLRQAFGDDEGKYFEHFKQFGMKEGRQANSLFDVRYYKNQYKDLQNAFGNNLAKYYEHFINFGVNEGRSPNSQFNFNTYKGRYQDLQNAFGGNKKKYYRHWLEFGQHENRKGYATGAKRVGETGYVWTQEGQRETYLRASDHAVLTRVGADDRIYNAMASENLWQAANNPSKFIAHGISGLIGDMYSSTAGGKVEQHFDNISFVMPNVKNYDELVTQMQQDKKFEKLIKAMTVGQLNGKSSDAKYHFKFG